MVKSPYSNNPADNAMQGKITNGNLTRSFDAPKVKEDSIYDETRAVYSNRLAQNAAEPEIKKPAEGFTQVHGFKDSELLTAEAFSSEDNVMLIAIFVGIIAFVLLGAVFGFFAIRIHVEQEKTKEIIIAKTEVSPEEK
jgi:hypothetical protein